MKLISVVALMLALAAPAFAESIESKTVSQSLTASRPTLSTEGLSLQGSVGYTVTLSAPASNTFWGSTVARCYAYRLVDATVPTYRWMRCPSFDITLTPGQERDLPASDFEPLVGMGRIFYGLDATVLDAGTYSDAGAIAPGTTALVTLTIRRK